VATKSRRLPRRNHFQEGPGFLFLATENGRPLERQDPDRLGAVVRRRRGADRGFGNIPPLRGVAELLTDLLRAA
jgi:hypothetical protein